MSSQKFPLVKDNELIKLHQTGKNNREIAKLLNESYNLVCNRIKELNLISNYIKQPNIETVKQLHSNGLSNKAIASQMGFTQHAIGRIVKELKLRPHHKGHLEIYEDKGRCIKCKEMQPLNYFKHSRKRGYDRICKTCYYIKRNQRMSKNLSSGLKHRAARCHSVAKKQKIPFNIDGAYLLDIYNKQNGKCFYTDRIMNTDFGIGASSDSISVDRVIPAQGYVKGNVVLCCRKINSVKNDLSLEEIKSYMPNWFQRLRNSNWLNKEGYPLG